MVLTDGYSPIAIMIERWPNRTHAAHIYSRLRKLVRVSSERVFRRRARFTSASRAPSTGRHIGWDISRTTRFIFTDVLFGPRSRQLIHGVSVRMKNHYGQAIDTA